MKEQEIEKLPGSAFELPPEGGAIQIRFFKPFGRIEMAPLQSTNTAGAASNPQAAPAETVKQS